MAEQFRPLPDDPDAAVIGEMFDANAEDWWLTAEGDYQAGAVEAMRNDGSGHQELVALEWPARLNHSTERRTIRLMMSPDDAVGLADVLAHTGRWMRARRRRMQ